MFKVKVITYNDIHLSINPMYLNVAVLFISKCLQICFILENLYKYHSLLYVNRDFLKFAVHFLNIKLLILSTIKSIVIPSRYM